MSKLSKKSLIASSVIGAITLAASTFAVADQLSDLHAAEARTFKASVKSQAKIERS